MKIKQISKIAASLFVLFETAELLVYVTEQHRLQSNLNQLHLYDWEGEIESDKMKTGLRPYHFGRNRIWLSKCAVDAPLIRSRGHFTLNKDLAASARRKRGGGLDPWLNPLSTSINILHCSWVDYSTPSANMLLVNQSNFSQSWHTCRRWSLIQIEQENTVVNTL